jgi:hypothetical protein
MRSCQVRGCEREATHGEDWQEPSLDVIETHRTGLRLRLTVEDIAVALLLCERHAQEAARSGSTAVASLLDGWGWKPLPRPGNDG